MPVFRRRRVGAAPVRASVRLAAWIVFAIFLLLPPLLIYVLTVTQPVKQARLPVPESPPPAAGSKPVQIPAESLKVWQTLQAKVGSSALEAAYLRSRTALAGGDSVGLYVSLSDSIVNLEIKGVPARTCKILSYRLSPILRSLQTRGSLTEWLGQPFALRKDWATIPRAPIRFKLAPRDTIEAARLPADSIPKETQPVHYVLEFDRDLVLAVDQSYPPGFKESWKRTRYIYGQNVKTARQTLSALLQGEPLAQKLKIELELSREDAVAVYRALPRKAQLALHL